MERPGSDFTAAAELPGVNSIEESETERSEILTHNQIVNPSNGDLEISRVLAAATAQHIAWLIDSAILERGRLTLNGWALITNGTRSSARILVNGSPVEDLKWFESPDLAVHFFDIPSSAHARFVATMAIDRIPSADYYRFELEQNGDTGHARRTAWWLQAERSEDADAERMSRVIGTGDPFQFALGGATLFHRIDDYLNGKFGRRYGDFDAILDWGCGAGRLLSHFGNVKGPEVWGADVDGDNLEYCRLHYPFAHCEKFPLRPPTSIPSSKFDLIIGISVCTHLAERDQHLWLDELRRISKPGGIVLVSIQGYAQSGLYRFNPNDIRQSIERGFHVVGVNPAINELLTESTYYKDVVQTRDNVAANWSRHFEVVDFVDGMAANQDMVVMRRT